MFIDFQSVSGFGYFILTAFMLSLCVTRVSCPTELLELDNTHQFLQDSLVCRSGTDLICFWAFTPSVHHLSLIKSINIDFISFSQEKYEIFLTNLSLYIRNTMLSEKLCFD